MNYIVLDLEWNQSNTGKEPEAGQIPFEIIDIGAVKLDDGRKPVGEYNQLIRPAIYHQMHRVTGDLIHLQMKDLKKGRPFEEAVREFLSWCGEDFIFCTWGPLDLFELQRNMHYYHMTPLSATPVKFLDVQKLFAIACEDSKQRRSLEYAIDFLNLEKDIPFHRALSDASYAARILSILPQRVLSHFSIDTYVLPRTRQEEIHAVFSDYKKYISREFSSKQEAMEDQEVISTKCYLCHRNLRKKIRWFSPNGKHYYSVALCPVHGMMKFKIRVRKTEHGTVYVVKTSKFISEEDCRGIAQKKEQAREHHRAKKTC